MNGQSREEEGKAIRLEIRMAAGRRRDKVGRKRRIEEMLIDGAHISMSHPTFRFLN